METHLSLHPDNATHLKLSKPQHVEALCRHLFKDSPYGMSIVEKTFSTKTMPVELKPKAPKDHLIHEPYSAS